MPRLPSFFGSEEQQYIPFVAAAIFFGLVVGSGAVATAACRVLVALEARVTVTSRDRQRLSALESQLRGRIATRVISPAVLEE